MNQNTHAYGAGCIFGCWKRGGMSIFVDYCGIGILNMMQKTWNAVGFAVREWMDG